MKHKANKSKELIDLVEKVNNVSTVENIQQNVEEYYLRKIQDYQRELKPSIWKK